MQKNFRNKGGCCSAIGCSKRAGTNLISQVKMYRFPTDISRRIAWCIAMKREKWMASDNSLLCNAHFITGKPSSDPEHPDYIPSLFSFNKNSKEEGETKLSRFERRINRSKPSSTAQLLCTAGTSTISIDPDPVCITESENKDACIQTSVTMEQVFNLEKELQYSKLTNETIRTEMILLPIYEQIINSNDRVFKFHTGMEKKEIFFELLKLVLTMWQPKITLLKPEQQFLMVCMKLRMGLKNQDLALRFGVSVGCVSKIFNDWLDVLYIITEKFIIWPSKKTLRRSMPQCFKDASLSNVCCIIDCTEIFIEKPHNLDARSQTYSNYKGHNTIKILVGIAPTGNISFVSQAWGGRVSDKELTIRSGLLDLIQPNDVILADRGFNIEDILAARGAKLCIPSFTKGKSQLSSNEVLDSRKMSKVRVHVERAIRKIKTYKILESTLPITFIQNKCQHDLSAIDKIIRVVCGLCNLSNPIIKFNI